MDELSLIIRLWIILGVIGYFLTREAYLNSFNSWSKDESQYHLILILSGPVLFAAGLVVYILSKNDDTED